VDGSWRAGWRSWVELRVKEQGLRFLKYQIKLLITNSWYHIYTGQKEASRVRNILCFAHEHLQTSSCILIEKKQAGSGIFFGLGNGSSSGKDFNPQPS
jgi:hypothetical protein